MRLSTLAFWTCLCALGTSSCQKSNFTMFEGKNKHGPSPSQTGLEVKPGLESSGEKADQTNSKGDSPKDASTQKASSRAKKAVINSSGFLRGSEFKAPNNLVATTELDLNTQIQNNGAFFPNGWEARDGQECAEIAMDRDLLNGVIEAKDGVATVNFGIDASICNANFGPVALTWQPGKGLLHLSCATDLEDFNGQTWGDSKSSLLSLCEESGEARILYNSTVVGVLDLSGTGSPIAKQNLTVKVARMSPEDTGCLLKKEGNTVIYGACRSIIQTERENPGFSTYAEIFYDQLKATPGTNMFKSGTAQFSINGWQGTLHYQPQGATWHATHTLGTTTKGELLPFD